MSGRADGLFCGLNWEMGKIEVPTELWNAQSLQALPLRWLAS